jgi:phosphodiesterase/alkaline phosphatase D-like protein
MTINLALISSRRTFSVDRLWTGIPTATTAMCSVRTASAVPTTAKMVVSTSSDLSNPVLGAGVATDATYGLAKPSITGLTPNTQYYYGVSVNGIIDLNKKGQFHTPASGAHSFSFAFGSCSLAGNVAAFDAIKARNPAFFMHLGDFFYDDLYATYGSNLAESHFQAVYNSQIDGRGDFHRQIPSSYNWSEHDYLGSAVGRDSAGNAHPQRNVPIDAFRRRVPVTLASSTSTDAVYYSFVYGRCRFVVIDSMSNYQYVGPLDTSAGNTMLGATQKQWVKDEVTAAAAAGQIVFFVAENPWKSDNPGAQGSGTNWMGFTVERTDLTNHFISAGMADKIIILYGDSHTVWAASSDYSTTGVKNHKQPNFCAAPLHQGRSAKGGPWDTVPFPTSSSGQYQQYAYVGVNDTGSAITVTVTGYNGAGTTIMNSVSINMTSRKITPDFYNTATRAANDPVTTLAAVPLPTSTGLTGLLVAVVQTKNNDTHTCPTSGWTKVRQDNSGASFTVSVWTALEGAAAPTFNWTNASSGYARISVYASPSGAMFNGVKGSSVLTGTGASAGGAVLATTQQDTLVLALLSQAVQHSWVTNFWSKYSDVGSATSDTELCIGGRRMTAYPVQPADIAWVSGGSAVWVLQQLELAVA